jgi:hypothetical protein
VHAEAGGRVCEVVGELVGGHREDARATFSASQCPEVVEATGGARIVWPLEELVLRHVHWRHVGALASAMHVESAREWLSFAPPEVEMSSYWVRVRSGPFPNDRGVPGCREGQAGYFDASFQWEDFAWNPQEAVVCYGAYGGVLPILVFGDAWRILSELLSHLVLSAMVKSSAGAEVDEVSFVRISSYWSSEFDLELGCLLDESVADCIGDVVVETKKEMRELEVVEVRPKSVAVLKEL